MIKLKSSNNVQTFYIAKGCSDVCISDNTLPMGSYTKAEADERFQPKGDYPTLEDVNIIKEDLENNIDELSNTLSSEIAELEVSKQETFQVNQPLYFERSDEDLTLNVNLEDYATKDELNKKQDSLVSGENIKTINGESILGGGNIELNIDSGLPYVVFNNDFTWSGDLEGVYSALQNNQPANVYYRAFNNDVLIAERYDASSEDVCRIYFHKEGSEGVHWVYRVDVFYDEGVFELDYSSIEHPSSYYAGNNIEISSGRVISWDAPDIQFVNTIFTDDEMLKYAIADFKGGYTEKEFPLATTTSAGLMSPEDKAKLDAGSSVESAPYIKVERNGTISDGDALAVFNALQAYKPATVLIQDSIYLVSYALMESFYVASSTKIEIWAHSEFTEGTYHNTFKITLTKSGDNVTSSAVSRDNHTYVDKSAYDTKVSEIDTAISDLQAQIGNIATVLDNIQGEVI